MTESINLSSAYPFDSHYVEVLGSRLHYIDEGAGDPIVFLHGNPTWSYLWRNVLPRLRGEGRLLAPDLIGMGRSDQPDLDYSLADHERYLDGWFDALALERITLVLHDWGTALGISWARRHPDRVRGLALMEAVLRRTEYADWDPRIAEAFRGFRTPGMGEKMVLEENFFVEKVLPASIVRRLTDAEMAAYRAPFPTPASRRPTLAFPRAIPLGGEPESTMALLSANERYLATDPVPKLLLTCTPGILVTAPVVDWCRKTIASLEIEHLGPGIHYVQEDHPEQIGDRVKAWRRRALA